MHTYLFGWNPVKWPWEDINRDIEIMKHTGVYRGTWSCANHRRVVPGDRAFLIRLGVNPKGIMGSGKVTSEPFPRLHWNGKSGLTFYVQIDFDVLLNPDTSPILSLELLRFGNLARQNWTPQSSGISIAPEYTAELEALWDDFLQEHPPG